MITNDKEIWNGAECLEQNINDNVEGKHNCTKRKICIEVLLYHFPNGGELNHLQWDMKVSYDEEINDVTAGWREWTKWW